MKALAYLLGGGMALEGALTLVSPRMVEATYRRWQRVIPRPLFYMYQEVGTLSDRTLRGIGLWEFLTGCLLMALAARMRKD